MQAYCQRVLVLNLRGLIGETVGLRLVNPSIICTCPFPDTSSFASLNTATRVRASVRYMPRTNRKSHAIRPGIKWLLSALSNPHLESFSTAIKSSSNSVRIPIHPCIIALALRFSPREKSCRRERDKTWITVRYLLTLFTYLPYSTVRRVYARTQAMFNGTVAHRRIEYFHDLLTPRRQRNLTDGGQ